MIGHLAAPSLSASPMSREGFMDCLFCNPEMVYEDNCALVVQVKTPKSPALKTFSAVSLSTWPPHHSQVSMPLLSLKSISLPSVEVPHLIVLSLIPL